MVSLSFLSLPLILHELYKKEVIVTSITLIPSNSRLLSHSLPWLDDPEFLDGGPRTCLFCPLLSWLVSPEDYCPCRTFLDSTKAPVCLYCNCIQLDRRKLDVSTEAAPNMHYSNSKLATPVCPYMWHAHRIFYC